MNIGCGSLLKASFQFVGSAMSSRLTVAGVAVTAYAGASRFVAASNPVPWRAPALPQGSDLITTTVDRLWADNLLGQINDLSTVGLEIGAFLIATGFAWTAVSTGVRWYRTKRQTQEPVQSDDFQLPEAPALEPEPDSSPSGQVSFMDSSISRDTKTFLDGSHDPDADASPDPTQGTDGS